MKLALGIAGWANIVIGALHVLILVRARERSPREPRGADRVEPALLVSVLRQHVQTGDSPRSRPASPPTFCNEADRDEGTSRSRSRTPPARNSRCAAGLLHRRVARGSASAASGKRPGWPRWASGWPLGACS